MNITEVPELAKAFTLDVKKHEDVRKEVVSLQNKASDLLPFEAEQFKTILDKKSTEAQEIYNNYNPLDKKYKRIDMNYISKLRIWNNSLKMYVPRFAIYNMDNKVLEMKIKEVYADRSDVRHYIDVDLKSGRDREPKFCENYGDINIMTGFQMFCHNFNTDEHTHTISHKFEGFLPDEIRNIVKDVTTRKEVTPNSFERDFALENLYLIEESYNWKSDYEKKKEPVRNWDPVIVGIKNNIAYYICSFDVTPAEKFLVSEMVG